jgi:hypothetical protein
VQTHRRSSRERDGFCRNLGKPRFLTVCTGCYLCRPQGTCVNVGSLTSAIWALADAQRNNRLKHFKAKESYERARSGSA